MNGVHSGRTMHTGTMAVLSGEREGNTGPCAPFSKPERLAQRLHLHVCMSAYHSPDLILVARRIREVRGGQSLSAHRIVAGSRPECRPLIPHAYAPGLQVNARALMIRWMFWDVEDAIERTDTSIDI